MAHNTEETPLMLQFSRLQDLVLCPCYQEYKQ